MNKKDNTINKKIQQGKYKENDDNTLKENVRN